MMNRQANTHQASSFWQYLDFDSELQQECRLSLEHERYGEAVRNAFLLVEDRLRESTEDLEEMSDTSSSERINDLIGKAFRSGDGPLAQKMHLDSSQGSAIRDLLLGAFRLFRNPGAHRRVSYEAGDAYGALALANWLLRYLGQAQSPYERLFREIERSLAENLRNESGLRTRFPENRKHMQIFITDMKGHYELRFLKGKRYIEVGLHFEGRPEDNRAELERLKRQERRLRERLQGNLTVESWGKHWARAYQKLPWTDPEMASASALANALSRFIDATRSESHSDLVDHLENLHQVRTLSDEQKTMESVFERVGTSPKVRDIADRLIHLIQKWNPQVAVRIGRRDILFYTPQSRFAGFRPNKDNLYVFGYTGDQPLPPMKRAKNEPWSRISLKVGSDLPQTVELLKECFSRRG